MTGEVLIRQLEYLAALARERHFGRAARTCFVSQPALSAGVRKLESELDVSIVLRGHHFEGFTPEGQLVVAWAHRILAERDSLKSDLEQMRGALSATLRVGVIPTAAPITPLISARFSAAHPRARVRVESLSSREIARRLAEFEIDVGITYVDDDASAPLRVLELYRERYFLLVPEEHELATKQPLHWRDAAALPLCLLTVAMRNRRIIEALMAGDGATPAPVVETDDMGVLVAQVTTRGLSTVVSQAWLHAYGVPGGMCARALPPRHPLAPVGLVLRPEDPSSFVAEALWQAVSDVDVEDLLAHAAAPFVVS